MTKLSIVLAMVALIAEGAKAEIISVSTSGSQDLRSGYATGQVGGSVSYSESTNGSSAVAAGQTTPQASNDLQTTQTSTTLSFINSTSSNVLGVIGSEVRAMASSYSQVYFQVDQDGLYNISGNAAAGLTMSGAAGNQFEQFAQVYLYDYNSSYLFNKQVYIASTDSFSSGSLPTQVTLFQGHQYLVGVYSYSDTGKVDGLNSSSGYANATLSITVAAVPEPSSLVLIGIAGLMGLGLRRFSA